MSKRSVTVLMGGPDAERDVSISSGIAVTKALQQSNKFDVKSMIIDTPTLQEIENIQSDVIFPVLHGPFGEGGPLQELLEVAGKTFVGSSSDVATTAMDKEATKQIALQLGIQTPHWCIVSKNSLPTIDPPLVLKPIDDGSSIDIFICMHQEDVESHVQSLLQNRSHILAETYIKGREVTVGIICGKALPIVEIIPPADLQSYDFEAKYEREDTQFIIDPDLPSNSCVASALDLYKKMGIRDIARVDFILNENGAWLLELNTMPGFTNHSLVPMAAKQSGIEMPELCTMLVDSATTS